MTLDPTRRAGVIVPRTEAASTPVGVRPLRVLRKHLERFLPVVQDLVLGARSAPEVLVLDDEDGPAAAIMPWSEFSRLKQAAGEAVRA
jgi:hypothetical protein